MQSSSNKKNNIQKQINNVTHKQKRCASKRINYYAIIDLAKRTFRDFM